MPHIAQSPPVESLLVDTNPWADPDILNHLPGQPIMAARAESSELEPEFDAERASNSFWESSEGRRLIDIDIHQQGIQKANLAVLFRRMFENC
jgi:hypothetical protein